MIRANRRSAGLARKELASRLGVTEAVVALWEDPEYDCVDLSILSRVARALGRRLEVRLSVPRVERVRQRPAWEDLISP
ncbi:MAG: helix-turn-helix transcriptional regulator [Planctomycetota bacterium]|nr:helix-turn-helix transcriptional regulator [Planctomycetota bacterium]